MNILFLTSNYPGPGIPLVSTAVCHYFTKEWVKAGHNIIVVHNMTIFPQIVNWGLKVFSGRLERKAGLTFNTKVLPEMDFELDGLRVFRRNILKLYPRKSFSEKAYNQQLKKIQRIIQDCNFTPDVIVGHWWTPQLRLISELGDLYNCKTAIVAHGEHPIIWKEYGEKRAASYLKRLDLIGYRSNIIKDHCITLYHLEQKRHFMCYSGIPNSFVGRPCKKIHKMRTFTFVGSLTDRKYPEKIIEALKDNLDYGITINYVGDGPMLYRLQELTNKYQMQKSVNFYGRISREEVGKVMEKTDCFVMISRGETFGLVYLEAMAYGCITIGAKNEGIDGVIINGKNGFLCEAGNWMELKKIINHLWEMSEDEISSIAAEGQKTANNMTDTNVAFHYLSEIENLLANRII